MTDPNIVAREVLKGYVIASFCQCGCPTHDGLKTNEAFLDHIAKALLSERTTAYKVCMDVVQGLACKQHPFKSVIEGGCDTNETLLDVFEAIRSEANKEIK